MSLINDSLLSGVPFWPVARTLVLQTLLFWQLVVHDAFSMFSVVATSPSALVVPVPGLNVPLTNPVPVSTNSNSTTTPWAGSPWQSTVAVYCSTASVPEQPTRSCCGGSRVMAEIWHGAELIVMFAVALPEVAVTCAVPVASLRMQVALPKSSVSTGSPPVGVSTPLLVVNRTSCPGSGTPIEFRTVARISTG